MKETVHIEPLFTAEQIHARIAELAQEIVDVCPAAKGPEGLLMVGPLKGAVVFQCGHGAHIDAADGVVAL